MCRHLHSLQISGSKYRYCTACKANFVPAPTCKCGFGLETQDERDMRMCEGCAIDKYEEQCRAREQRYLEDDKNWS